MQISKMELFYHCKFINFGNIPLNFLLKKHKNWLEINKNN